jgi:hypothetical protein
MRIINIFIINQESVRNRTRKPADSVRFDWYTENKSGNMIDL